MDAIAGEANRRRTFRIPVLSERAGVMLWINGVRIPARWLDESAGGFAVRTLENAALVEGTTGVLETQSDRVHVQVMNLRQESAGTRVGLKRLESDEDAHAYESFRSSVLGPAWLSLRHVRPGNASTAVMGLSVAVIVGAVVWGWTVFVGDSGERFALSPPQHSSSTLTKATRAIRQQLTIAAGEPGQWQSWLDQGLESVDVQVRTSAGAVLDEIANVAEHTGQSAEALFRAGRGGVVFLDSEVISRLKIDSNQQQQMRRIVSRAAQAALEILNRPQSGSQDRRFADASAVLEGYGFEALRVLSPQQRTQWQAMQPLPEATPFTAAAGGAATQATP